MEPLVRALTDAVEGEAAGYVHWGATSQDILDTASMLISRRVLELIVEALDSVAGECAGLAEAHRSTPMAGRTLQQAVPTTFGLKAAGWLVGVLEARGAGGSEERLAVQLGGAAGTLSAFGDAGPEEAPAVREELWLREPVRSLAHEPCSDRGAGSSAGRRCGAVAKIGLGRGPHEPDGGRRGGGSRAGGSSTMPRSEIPSEVR